MKSIAYIDRKGWKYIYKDFEENELYNLEEDPKEKKNLIGKSPLVERKMLKRIKKHIKKNEIYSEKQKIKQLRKKFLFWT